MFTRSLPNTLPRPTQGSASARWLHRVARAHSLWRSRRALARLTNTQLDDIGITRAQAQNEAARPFWDAPEHWQQ